MKYRVLHTTAYRYSQPVSLCHNQLHLTPRTLPRQSCSAGEVAINPAPSSLTQWTDYFGNRAHFFSVESPHDELIITGRSDVELSSPAPIVAAQTLPWEEVRESLSNPQTAGMLEAVQFRADSPFIRPSGESLAYAQASFTPGRPILEAALDLTGRINREFKYDQAATVVSTPTVEVFRQKRGVCQDFAHLEITCLRSLGLAARYVSGYLVTEPPPGKPKLVGADASHAWLSVYCGQAGWVDVDPTNNLMPDLRHITLAWGRDYGDVCPIQGVLIGGGQSTLTVSVDVAPA